MTEENEKKPRELKISIDSEQMKQMAMDLAKSQLKISSLEEKTLDQQGETKRILFKDEGESKPLLFNSDSDLATRKIQCYERFKDERFLSSEITTKEQLSQAVTNLVNEVANSRTKTPEGSAPLNDRQMGSNSQIDDLYRHKFQNEKELVSTLQKLSREGSTEAKSYLDALMVQYIKAKKANPNQPDAFYDPNSPENLPDLHKEGQFLVPEKGQGDIGKILEHWKQIRNAKREEGKA